MNAQLIEMDEKDYEEMLDEIYPDGVTVCGMTYSVGRALKEIDPVAFRCGMAEQPEQWECNECSCIYDNEEEANDCCID